MLSLKNWKKSLIVVLSVLLVAGALGELTRRVVLAQTAVGTKLHVDRVAVNFSNVGGPKRLASASVGVRDELGNPVAGALVEGNWSGCFSYKGSATTQLITYPESGITEAYAQIVANKATSCWGKPVKCSFTFTVTKISKAGYTYDATANVKTSDFRQCQ